MGKLNGWQFLYGLDEYQFWKLKHYRKDFYIDASFALSCKSIAPYAWIPLDKKLQKRVWENRKWNNKLSTWMMDSETQIVYYFVRCVFDKSCFIKNYVMEIESLFDIVDMDIVKELLSTVFFKFTNRLIEMAENGDYDNIRNYYLAFDKY